MNFVLEIELSWKNPRGPLKSPPGLDRAISQTFVQGPASSHMVRLASHTVGLHVSFPVLQQKCI